MGATQEAIAMLKKHEGFRAKPYLDTVGKSTVGYGINLEAGITEPEAATILSMRVEQIEARLCVAVACWHSLSDSRRAVLIDMAYNLGVFGLLAFKKFLAALGAGDYDRAAREMLDSKWARQVGARSTNLAGIIKQGA